VNTLVSMVALLHVHGITCLLINAAACKSAHQSRLGYTVGRYAGKMPLDFVSAISAANADGTVKPSDAPITKSRTDAALV